MSPLVLYAMGVLTGAAGYPALQPGPSECIFGAVGLLALAAFGRSSWPLAPAGLLLGLWLPARLPDPIEVTGPVDVRGVVVSNAGTVAVGGIEIDGAFHDAGGARVRVRFPGGAPPIGAEVVVRGRARPANLTRLPGEADPAWDLARARVVTEVRPAEVRVLGPPAPPVRTDGAVHAGLLRALVDGNRDGIPPDEVSVLRRTGTWHIVSISASP